MWKYASSIFLWSHEDEQKIVDSLKCCAVCLYVIVGVKWCSCFVTKYAIVPNSNSAVEEKSPTWTDALANGHLEISPLSPAIATVPNTPTARLFKLECIVFGNANRSWHLPGKLCPLNVWDNKGDANARSVGGDMVSMDRAGPTHRATVANTSIAIRMMAQMGDRAPNSWYEPSSLPISDSWENTRCRITGISLVW